MAALGAHQAEHADDQDHRPHAQGQQSDSGEDNPPGHHIQQGIHALAVPEAHIDVDDLAGDQVDNADADGHNQRHHGIGHRAESDAGAEGLHPAGHHGAGQEGVIDDLQHIAEEAAGEHAADGGGDTEILPQLEHIAHGLLGVVDLGDSQGHGKDDDAVGHIGEHEPKEEDVEGEDQGIGVDAALVGGEGVHLRHHVDALHPRGIVQQGGGSFLLRGVRQVVGTGELTQFLLELIHLIAGGPALQKYHRSVGEQLLLNGGLGHLLGHPVHGDLKGLALIREGGDLLLQRRALPGDLLQLPIDGGDVLRRGTGKVLEAHRTGGEGLQRLDRLLLLLLVAHQQEVQQLLVSSRLKQLRHRSRLLQRLTQGGGIRRGREGEISELCRPGLRLLQGEVQGGPGDQRRPAGGEPVFLGVGLRDLLRALVDLGCGLQGLRPRLFAEELRLRDAAALDEQPPLIGGVLLQRIQRGGDGVCLGLHIPQAGGFPLQKGRPLRVSQLVVRLGDLHTAQMEQPAQQIALLRAQCDKAQPLHFDDGHQTFTTLLTMSSAAAGR